MFSATFKTTPRCSCSCSCSFSIPRFIIPSKHNNWDPKYTKLKFEKESESKFSFPPLKSHAGNPSSVSVSCLTVTEAGNPSSVSVSCLTVTEDPAPAPAPTPSPLCSSEKVSVKLRRVVYEFKSLSEPIDRVKRLLHYATILPPMDESGRVEENRVKGCTTQVWVEATLDDEVGCMRFKADSDSEISKGFCSCLVYMLDGATPEEVGNFKAEDLVDLNVGIHGRENSRVNTWQNVFLAMQNRTKALVAEKERNLALDHPFPSLIVKADDISAKASFSEAQAQFLLPNGLRVKKRCLTASQKLWPHIHVSDSLVMADTTVEMEDAGCQYITVLVVDFISEIVLAIHDQAGFGKDGRCIVHNLFGCEIVEKIKEIYSDAYLTAHFEVPGEMFSPAKEAK